MEGFEENKITFDENESSNGATFDVLIAGSTRIHL